VEDVELFHILDNDIRRRAGHLDAVEGVVGVTVLDVVRVLAERTVAVRIVKERTAPSRRPQCAPASPLAVGLARKR
jgi:hypothetical protein